MPDYEALPEERLPEQGSLAGSPDPAAETTGLALQTPEEAFGSSNVEALVQRAGELRGLSDVSEGLECFIIQGGARVMAYHAEADPFLEALKDKDPSATTMGDIAAKIAPDKGRLEALLAAIRDEPMDQLAAKMNEVLGGVSGGFGSTDDALALQRRSGMEDLRRNAPTDGAAKLLTGHLDKLLEDHPEVVDGFRQTGDPLIFLRDIRALYASGHDAFTEELAQAISIVDQKVARGEADVADLQSLADSIYTPEITALRAKLADASGERAQAMLQTMVDKREAEAALADNEFTQQRTAVRGEVLESLGAGPLYHIRIPEPVRTTIISHHESSKTEGQ